MSDDYDMDDLRKTWPLANVFHDVLDSEDKLAIVVGAYKGKVMQFLYETYGCKVTGYEPQQWAAELASNHLSGVVPNTMWNLHPFGLITESHNILAQWYGGELDMGEYGTDACSLVRNTREHGVGEFVDAATQDLSCDLMVMNIEGYEYTLLPAFAETPCYPAKAGDRTQLSCIKALAVQFHPSESMTLETAAKVNSVLHARYGEPKIDQFPLWVYYAS